VYNRGDVNPEDPWLSTQDHATCKVGGVSNCMLYGENDTWGYTESKNAHGGADVYIKQTN